MRSCSLASRSIGIFLRRIAQRRQLLLAEHRVRVDVDLGVERDELAGLGDDERVDLEQRGIALEVDAVQRHQDGLELADLRALEAEAESELAALVGLQPRGGIDVDAQDLLRRVRGHFFDVHAAGGGGDDGHAAALAIQRERQVDLAVDLRAGLDVHRLDGQAFGTGLFGHQPLAEHVRGGGAHRVEVARQLDAAGLAAAARMHLGLDHPQLAA